MKESLTVISKDEGQVTKGQYVGLVLEDKKLITRKVFHQENR